MIDTEVHRLRSWLQRIEEACSAQAASSKERLVREAALTALRGVSAPPGPGLPPMFRVGDRIVSAAYDTRGAVLARDGSEVWVRFDDGRRLTLMVSDLVLEEDVS
jgi:hypothetical protein